MERGPLALWWFLAAAIAAIAVMLAVALSTLRPPLDQAAVTARGYAVRRWWFVVLVLSVVAAFALSIPSFPYPTAAQMAGSRHFPIVAQQFAFQVPAQVPLGVSVIFDVTSKDVNHGFGIYDPMGALVAQVQAMPGYTNHLPVRFVTAGTYSIRCLEYCGVAHHLMQASFEVR
jgi:cytochrome c oxidase subunit II